MLSDDYLFDEEILHKVSLYKANLIVNKKRKDKAIQDRLDKGLKTNLITSYELVEVIDHWLCNNRSNLKSSFSYVYDKTEDNNKEKDWVDATLRARHFSRELTTAFSLLKHSSVDLLRNSKHFDLKSLSVYDTLSKRIRKMDIALKYEEAMIEKDEKIRSLQEEIANINQPWEEKALLLIGEGYTQRVVAEKVGKSLVTIKRLVKSNKEKHND